MIYLILAVVSSAAFAIATRLSESRASGSAVKSAMNYLLCTVLSGFHMGWGSLAAEADGLAAAAGMGLFNGLLYLTCFTMMQLNVAKNGVVLSSTFMKLGLLVPMALSVFFFHETPSAMQATGFLLAVFAIVLINFERERTVMGFKLGLILLLLAGGASDGMSKVYEQLGSSALSGHFLFYTFASAAVLSLLLAAIRKERPTRDAVLYGLLIGAPNYYSSRFILEALYHMPGVIVYPSYSVGTIVVVALAGVLFFREKLGRRQCAAIAIILAALILLNL